jgi:hypothetical protein
LLVHVGVTVQVFLEQRRLAGLLAEPDLVVDQIEDRLGIGGQTGLSSQTVLHRDGLALPP